MLQTQLIEKTTAPVDGLVHIQCPICPTDFRVQSGLVWHLMLEHWWDRTAAEEYCGADA